MITLPLPGPTRSPAHGALQRCVIGVSSTSARRPRTVLALWLLAVAVLVVLGAATGTRTLSDAAAGTGESMRADERLASAHLTAPPGEQVLVRSSSAARTRAVTAQLEGHLSALPQVTSMTDPAQVPALTRDGGRTSLLQVSLRGTGDEADSTVAPVRATVARVAAASPGVRVAETGDGSAARAADGVLGEDLHRVELVSLPLTLLVLLLVFGSLVSALVPLAFGATCVAAALGAVAVASQVLPVSDSTSTLVVLIGLAVGVDYSLFLVRRRRVERLAGAGRDEALAAAVAATSRAIVVAGVTVAVALGGLALTGMALFASLAVGTVLVVGIAVVGAVTVLPAVLALLGDRVDAGRLHLPGARRRQRPGAGARAGAWARTAERVCARPVLALVAAVVVLVGIAAPAAGLRTGDPGIDAMPLSVPAVAAAHAASRAFPAAGGQAELVVRGRDLGAPASRAALAALGRRARTTAGGAGAVGVRVARDGRTAAVDVPTRAVAGSRAATQVARLRTLVATSRPAALRDARVLVTGSAAEGADFSARLRARTPLTVGGVLVVALALLVASFGSLWLALGVIALDLLSVGAAYGMIAAVFQHSWASGALGFTPTGAVVQWVPLFAFVVLFGLSMDYTVLVLERIAEERSRGLVPRAAAAAGVGATGGTISAAAVVMVAVFALFAGLRLVEFKEVGLGLAAAVAVDATLVRAVALPALVALLGERGWRRRGGPGRALPEPATGALAGL